MIIYADKYCVYQHIANGEVFYIGMGSPSRPFHFNKRNKKWNSIRNAAPSIEIKIIAWFDTPQHASQFEFSEIHRIKPAANLGAPSPSIRKHGKAEAGRKGGTIKWARIPKNKRSQIMREVANARHHKQHATL